MTRSPATVDLMKKYGPPGSSRQQLQRDPRPLQRRKVRRHVGRCDDRRFVHQRSETVEGRRQGCVRASADDGDTEGCQLAVGVGTGRSGRFAEGRAANKFITWATSKEYINLVGKEVGWGNVPTGTRKSTYESGVPEGRRSSLRLRRPRSIAANPNSQTLPKSPYMGISSPPSRSFSRSGLRSGSR